MNTLIDTAKHLNELSKAQHQPLFEQIEWPDALADDDLVMSPELTSLYKTDYFDILTPAQINQLAMLELVNFFSVNIHGERHLIAGIAERIHQEQHPVISQYLHHFVDEENKHMACFAEFCQRYAGFIYNERGVRFAREYAPGEEDFLFFTRALIFEELVDSYNATMARDERLCAVSKQINAMHHREESRHRAFGRRLVVSIFEENSPSWNEATLQGIRDYLAAYLRESWKSLYNPEVYAALGFEQPYKLREHIWEHPATRKHRKTYSAGIIRFLIKQGILIEEPQL